MPFTQNLFIGLTKSKFIQFTLWYFNTFPTASLRPYNLNKQFHSEFIYSLTSYNSKTFTVLLNWPFHWNTLNSIFHRVTTSDCFSRPVSGLSPFPIAKLFCIWMLLFVESNFPILPFANTKWIAVHSRSDDSHLSGSRFMQIKRKGINWKCARRSSALCAFCTYYIYIYT